MFHYLFGFSFAFYSVQQVNNYQPGFDKAKFDDFAHGEVQILFKYNVPVDNSSQEREDRRKCHTIQIVG